MEHGTEQRCVHGCFAAEVCREEHDKRGLVEWLRTSPAYKFLMLTAFSTPSLCKITEEAMLLSQVLGLRKGAMF